MKHRCLVSGYFNYKWSNVNSELLFVTLNLANHKSTIWKQFLILFNNLSGLCLIERMQNTLSYKKKKKKD